MSTTFDHDKISVTAKLVAFYRKFSDIPYAQEIAEFIKAEEAFQKIIHDTGLKPDDLKDFAPAFELRYKSIVTLILNSKIDQVLELASGFSLRGFAMTKNGSLTYVESDLPDLTSEKNTLLAGIPRTEHQSKHHKVASANALDLSELRAAVSHLDKSKPLIVVNEGLMQYFSIDERSQLFKNVRALLSDFAGGQWITPDFSFKSVVENVSEQRKKLREAVTGVTARKMYEGAFEDETELETFIQQEGFTATTYHQMDEVTELTTLKEWKISPEVLEKLRQMLLIWVLTPN